MIDECRVRYQPRNTDPRARIVRCGLPAGHTGPHCEEPGAPEWDNPPSEQRVTDSTHVYRSTACGHQHHDRCRRVCKWCSAGCVCTCHREETK